MSNDSTTLESSQFNAKTFVNRKTGYFQFPVYKVDKRFAVQIHDKTDYKRAYRWQSYSLEERRAFTLTQFEAKFVKPQLTVDAFHTLFDNLSMKALASFQYLKGQGLALDKLQKESYVSSSANTIYRNLYEQGYLDKHEFDNPEDYRQFLNKLPLRTLRAACQKSQIPSKLKGELLKKDKQIDFIILSKRKLVFPFALYRNGKFTDVLAYFYEHYIQELEKNMRRFHPLYIPEIWAAALKANSSVLHPELIAKIREKMMS